MAKILDQIIVVDIEATCWRGRPPEGMENEIIEVGLCLVDPRGAERHSPRSILVRPEKSEVGAFCTELTSITPEMAAGGVSFAECCSILRREYRSADRLWVSSGDFDRRQFERQCAARGVPYPFGPSHLNVKTLFSLAFGLRNEIGLRGAAETLGLAFEGRHHRGVDDAWNLAAVLCELLRRLRGESRREAPPEDAAGIRPPEEGPRSGIPADGSGANGNPREAAGGEEA